MALLWNFPFHTIATKYPRSSVQAEFGAGYVFTAKPSGPDIRVFTVSFPGMVYYVDAGGLPDATINPQWNMLALELFYQEKKLWDTWLFPHNVHGDLNVKFSQPLEVPGGVPGGSGIVAPFSVELAEIV